MTNPEPTEANTPCWTQCKMCEDYICNIHGHRVFGCECLDLEWWAERDMDPYKITVEEFKQRKAAYEERKKRIDEILEERLFWLRLPSHMNSKVSATCRFEQIPQVLLEVFTLEPGEEIIIEVRRKERDDES